MENYTLMKKIDNFLNELKKEGIIRSDFGDISDTVGEIGVGPSLGPIAENIGHTVHPAGFTDPNFQGFIQHDIPDPTEHYPKKDYD